MRTRVYLRRVGNHIANRAPAVMAVTSVLLATGAVAMTWFDGHVRDAMAVRYRLAFQATWSEKPLEMLWGYAQSQWFLLLGALLLVVLPVYTQRKVGRDVDVALARIDCAHLCAALFVMVGCVTALMESVSDQLLCMHSGLPNTPFDALIGWAIASFPILAFIVATRIRMGRHDSSNGGYRTVIVFVGVTGLSSCLAAVHACLWMIGKATVVR